MSNSRYVLQKAQWLTPTSCFFTCLKGNEKSLSVKYPKEDPTKPPLRRNIPKDSSVEYYQTIVPETHRRGLSEQRSTSLISRTANSSETAFDNGLLPRSESEIQLSKFTTKQYFGKSEEESDVGAIELSSELPFQAADEVVGEVLLSGKTKEDDNPERTDFLFQDSYRQSNDKFDARKMPANQKETPGGGSNTNSDSSDYKIVHIIIDFPKKISDNLDLMIPKPKENAAAKLPNNFPILRENNEPEMQSSKIKQLKKWRSRSLSGIATKPNKKRFEVHEIEDSGTYVLHLKFKNATGVDVVPEKEVRTRNTTIQDFPGPTSLSSPSPKAAKDLGVFEENPEILKYFEKKKKLKHSKSGTKPKSTSLTQINPTLSENVQAKEFLEWQQPQYYELPVSDSFEEKKILKSFTKDDSGMIKAATNKSTFEIPRGKEEAKPEAMSPKENATVKDEIKTEVELAMEQSESAEEEKILAEPAGEKQEIQAETTETESAPHIKNEEFEVYNYRDAHRYAETSESLPNGPQRSPPTDWMVPSFMHSATDHQQRPENANEDKHRLKKKYKNSTSSGKKGKGKKKKNSSGYKAAKSERRDFDAVDFKNGASSVPIKCDKPTYAMKLSAAYPPLLNEAMKRRYYRYRSNTVYNGKTGMSLEPKNFEMNPKCVKVVPSQVPSREECSGCHKDTSLNANNTTNVPKISDNICNIANENMRHDKGTASVDSLAMMKKVKEIVDLDLNNAIKIFKPETVGVVKSVMVSTGDGEWVLDEKELQKCLTIRKSEFMNDIKKAESTQDFFGDKAVNLLKYLPATKESQTEMKLDHSVVTFNPDTNKFVVDVEDLQEAIKRRTEESFDDVVVEKLEGLLTGSETEPILVFNAANDTKMKLKSGDSILVFDEETQKWKVDYSILEKREHQMRVEEELTKRSELILETIEKIEKGNIPSIPKPETRDRKTFDYNKEQWKDYGSEKKSKSKSKSPFKESDAKEIRKKNSDLYEDLFVKKDKIKKSDGSKSTEIKLCKQAGEKNTGMGKESEATQKSGTVPEKPPPISQRKESPPSPDNKIEDDNYWEAFLNMTIPARSTKEIVDVTETKKPKIRAPAPPPPSPPTPPTPSTPPVSPPQGPKIEEPKFKIHLPFTGDLHKKQDKGIPPKKPESKEEKPKAKAPTPPGISEKSKLKTPVPPKKSEKQKGPETSVPPPAKPPPPLKKKEEPKTKPSPPSTASKKEEPKPPAVPKKEEKKKKETTSKKGGTDVSSPKSLPKDSPKSGDKKEPQVKAPPPSNIKPKEDPKTAGKKEKSAADHYISENIVELSRSSKDKTSNIKSNKIETVKLNITADRRLPSKVMEINLNRKCENPKESTVASKKEKKSENGVENRIFYKKFEKYKTPFSDPEYEEKSMRIKSDIASNPNLKKLGNWNKTLVLHDIAKPPENIENWLKDETDKMATLLLKVLQEASDGKPRRKSSRTKLIEKPCSKTNPYDNIRKKQETTTHESFLFKVRPVNLSPESDKKRIDQEKTVRRIESVHDIPIQTAASAKSAKISEVRVPAAKKNDLVHACPGSASTLSEVKPPKSGLETTDSLISRDFLQQCRLANDITDDIPGPVMLKRISSTWKFFPVFSAQMTIFTLLRLFQLANLGKSFLDSSNLDKCRRLAFSKLFAKYGPIVNVQGPLSGSVILVHKPEHLSAVFEQDASIPTRSVFDSLEQSRREAEEKYLPTGIYTEWNTPQWTELKRYTNDPLIKGREKFFTTVEAAGTSLVSNIRKYKNRQNYASDDFMDEIKRWSLEGLCNVLFEKSFGFLEGRSRNMSWILEPDKLFMSIEEATSYLSKCERGFQTWRLMTTPSAIGLKQSYHTLSGIVAKQLYQAEANLKNKSEILKDSKIQHARDLTFLESMLLNDGMTPEEITCNIIDIMLIGTNAMSSALGFLLYDLSQNMKVQNKLINEVRNALPEKHNRLDYNKFHSLKYLHACLKESLRLHMPIPIFYRMLQNDIILSNYIVPKGTFVVMDYRVSCMKEQIFGEPEKYYPERWLEDEKWIQNFHPFNAMPLCHGLRAELAKRVMEMQLLTCVAKIVRNFVIEYQFGEIQGTDSVISFPDKPLKFNFTERDF